MAAKIKDGLFVGDADCSHDPEFLELNKISNLVNLTGKQVANVWASHGLVYLTYNWEERVDYPLCGIGLDDEFKLMVIVQDIIDFIDMSLKHGVSVLMFSKKGTGRCLIAACLYLMGKYHWGVDKCFDYIYSKKPDMNVHKSVIQQLYVLDKKLTRKWYDFLRSKNVDIDAPEVLEIEELRCKAWDPSYLTRQHRYIPIASDNDDDEGVLINSFNNSRLLLKQMPTAAVHASDSTVKTFKLRFDNMVHTQTDHGDDAFEQINLTLKPSRSSLKGKNGAKSNTRSSRHYSQLDETSVISDVSSTDPMSPTPTRSSPSAKAQHKNLYDYVGLDSMSDKKSSNDTFYNGNSNSNSNSHIHHSSPSIQDVSRHHQHTPMSAESKQTGPSPRKQFKSVPTKAPSLYELASMPSPTATTAGTNINRAYPIDAQVSKTIEVKVNYDPLSAFENVQLSRGPIKIKHDVTLINNSSAGRSSNSNSKKLFPATNRSNSPAVKTITGNGRGSQTSIGSYTSNTSERSSNSIIHKSTASSKRRGSLESNGSRNGSVASHDTQQSRFSRNSSNNDDHSLKKNSQRTWK